MMHDASNSRLTAIRCLAVTIGVLVVSILAVAAASGIVTLPEGAGRAKFIQRCSNCHEMSVVVAQGRTRAEWGDMIATMVDRGAIVPEADFTEIQDYLAEFFPLKGTAGGTLAQPAKQPL